MKYFDVHLHLPTPDRAGLDALLRHIDAEPDMVGAHLILNTPEEVAFVHAQRGALPPSIRFIPYYEPGASLPPEFQADGWYKIHPGIARLHAGRVAEVRDALLAAPRPPKGIVVHCFPWGPQLEYNTGLPLVVELARAMPRTWILVAHGGGYESWQLRAHAGSFDNVLFDFSVSMAYYRGSDALRPFQRYLRHDPQCLLFGSDWPSAQCGEQLEECVRLAGECGVDAARLERLFLDNTRRIWPEAFGAGT